MFVVTIIKYTVLKATFVVAQGLVNCLPPQDYAELSH